MITRWISAVCLAAVLAACTCERRNDPPPVESPREPSTRARVAAVEHAVSDHPLPDDEGTWRLHRFEIPLDRARLDVVDQAFEGTLAEALEREEAMVVVNGGYWDRSRDPEGLTVVAGVERAPFASALGGGVLVVDDGFARLLDAEAEGFVAPSDVDFAQQCRPRLVVDGAVNGRSDDGRRADRTGLCIRDGGRTLEVVMARTHEVRGHGGPSLYRFAEALVEAGCEQALNLDGGSSSGIAWRARDGTETLPTRTAVRLAIVARWDDPR